MLSKGMQLGKEIIMLLLETYVTELAPRMRLVYYQDVHMLGI